MNMDVEFLQAHQLAQSYESVAKTYFLPVVQWLAQQVSGREKPLLVGINGAQGSGKSTLADLWVHWCQKEAGIRACSVSIDDFYLSRLERKALAEKVHPLFATRGVPGTHDVSAAKVFFQDISARKAPLQVPRFNKAQDDPFPQTQWPVLSEPVDILFFEGWCVGSLPQPPAELAQPINVLEAEEDPEAQWRTYVNTQLAGPYQAWFALLDYLILLEAPSFDCVADWRWHQEEKLRAQLSPDELKNATGLMTRSDIDRFVSFYERITRDNLNRLPDRADFVFSLQKDLSINEMSGRLVRAKSGGGFEFG